MKNARHHQISQRRAFLEEMNAADDKYTYRYCHLEDRYHIAVAKRSGGGVVFKLKGSASTFMTPQQAVKELRSSIWAAERNGELR